MKVPKSVLEQIVREEVVAHLRSLVEAPKGTDVVDADDEKKAKEKEDGKGKSAPLKPQGGPEAAKRVADEPKETKPGPKPAPAQQADPDSVGPNDTKDASAEDDEEMEDDESEEDAAEVTGGKIADAITGKTVQSITMEPESKILPGAQEITLAFREMPDPLKILVTKTGQVKFHFRGLHNTLGEAAPAAPAPVAPQGVASAAGPIVKKTNHPDKFSMSNDEYLAWTKSPPAQIKVVSAQGGKPIADMDQNAIKHALSKASFMKGMAKGISSDAEYWIAPVIRRK